MQKITIVIHTTSMQRAKNFIAALPPVLKSERIEYSIEKVEEERKKKVKCKEGS